VVGATEEETISGHVIPAFVIGAKVSIIQAPIAIVLSQLIHAAVMICPHEVGGTKEGYLFGDFKHTVVIGSEISVI